jgi:hypothetical protein
VSLINLIVILEVIIRSYFDNTFEMVDCRGKNGIGVFFTSVTSRDLCSV